MINDSLKEFCKKYLITLLDTEKRCAVQREQLFINAKDKNEVTEVTTATEPKITLSIPLSRLETLTSIESVFFNNTDDVSRRNTYVRWMVIQREEMIQRAEFPAVQDAYEKYSMLLNLTRKNK